MSEARKLRVAILGCGQIADAHLQEITHIPRAMLVAACDAQIEVAGQAARRFDVPAAYDDIDRMMDEAKPDVVHVTTPPHSHAPLARRLLDAGAHVYVEKPFTVDLAEAEALLAHAESRGRKVCAGHDQLFDPVWVRAEEIADRGELGEVVHVDSVYGYNLDGPFGKLMFNHPNHWLHRLPGGLFQNNISHALYRISKFLVDEEPRIWATTARRREGEPPSELRVMLQGRSVTGNVLFSSRARPVQRAATIYGTLGTLEAELDGRTLRWKYPPKWPGALGKVNVPWLQFREAAGNLGRNAGDFLGHRQHFFRGMRTLFSRFYDSILDGTPLPVPYADVLRVTRWMDTIFAEAGMAPRRSPE